MTTPDTEAALAPCADCKPLVDKYDAANHALQVERDALLAKVEAFRATSLTQAILKARTTMCVDCSKQADTSCHQCGGPWCSDCSDAMKGRFGSHNPCHTCRQGDDW